ncbi:hypothetical protein SCA6_001304 [Theobroma cacao]
MEWTGICGGMYEGHNKKLHMASGVYHSTCSEHIFEVNSGIIMDTHPIQVLTLLAASLGSCSCVLNFDKESRI